MQAPTIMTDSVLMASPLGMAEIPKIIQETLLKMQLSSMEMLSCKAPTNTHTINYWFRIFAIRKISFFKLMAFLSVVVANSTPSETIQGWKQSSESVAFRNSGQLTPQVPHWLWALVSLLWKCFTQRLFWLKPFKPSIVCWCLSLRLSGAWVSVT